MLLPQLGLWREYAGEGNRSSISGTASVSSLRVLAGLRTLNVRITPNQNLILCGNQHSWREPIATALAQAGLLVKVQDLEKVLEPLFYNWKAKRLQGESFGNLTTRMEIGVLVLLLCIFHAYIDSSLHVLAGLRTP